MSYHDYETMLYGEDGENPIRPTVQRCIHEAIQADTRLKVEIRVKHLGTTSTKAEHTFVVDAKEEHADVIIANIKDRLDAAPGDSFEGQIRVNFYASGNMATKYGSYTRQIRQAPAGFSGGGHQENPMMGMMNNFMNQQQSPQNNGSNGFEFSGMEEGGGFEDDLGGGEGDELGSGQNFSSTDNTQQMMQMMQMMMSQNGGNGGAVDQKMAMEWLNHTMSFLFRSLALQMSMFERSTKLVETYAMRFGLPQPLEQPKPERIIREVPMELEFPDFPQEYNAPVQQQPQQKPSVLPQLLNAAAAFAGNPGAAQLLQTAATMLTPPPPPPQPQPQPRPRPRPKLKRKKEESVSETDSPRYIKQEPPKPKTPIDGMDEPQGPSNFSFGLDGSHENINPFGKNEMFADFEEESQEEYEEESESEEFDFDEQHEEMDQDIQVPEGFPDLTGMSADKMKETVINWVNADPDNRKSQIMAMLPELSSLIM